MKKFLFLIIVHSLHGQSIYRDIEKVYLRSYSDVSSNGVGSNRVSSNSVSMDNLKLPEITDFKKKSIVFDLFSKNSNDEGSSIIKNHLWRDLDLFSADNTSLFNRIDRTYTSFGSVYLSGLLVRPTDNLEALKRRQGACKILLSNSDLLSKLELELENIKRNEKHLLAFWDEDAFIHDILFKKLYFNNAYLKSFNDNPYALELLRRFGILRPFSSTVEKLVLLSAIHHFVWNMLERELQINVRLKLLEEEGERDFVFDAMNGKRILSKNKASGMKSFLTSILSSFVGGLDLKKDGREDIRSKFLKQLKELKQYEFKNGSRLDFFNRELHSFVDDITSFKIFTLKDFKFFFQKILNGTESFLKSLPFDESSSEKAKGVLVMGLSVVAAWQIFSELREILPKVGDEQERDYYCNYLQQRLSHVHSFLSSLKEIHHIIITNKELEDSFEQFNDLNNLFDGFVEKSKKLEKFLDFIFTDTFSNGPSFFSLKGRVLAAYRLLLEVKDELALALEALGEIDSYVSIAKLYKENQSASDQFVPNKFVSDQSVRYSFANYIEGKVPFLSLDGFWNPLVDIEVVVPNDIKLGIDVGAANAIVTGPNASGKSTILKGITISLLLAQSLGIVPAKDMQFTIFSKINTYLNITDDIGAGNSLFKAEVLRAQDLVNTLRNLDKDKFSFCISDEMFSGTSYEEGQAASRAVSKSLAEFKNSMCIIATHFPRMTELEDESGGVFKNYKVTVIKNEDGSLSYPYKLQDGKSNQHIAFDILINEGVLDPSILEELESISLKF